MKLKTGFKALLLFHLSLLIFSPKESFGHLSYSGVVDTVKLAQADSIKPKKPSTMNDTWFHSSEPDRHYIIDSTIFHLEEFNEVQRDGIEYMNLGNNGTAAFPMVYSMDKSTGFNVGYNQFDIYRYSKDSTKYYQVVRPYVELSMVVGLNYDQMFKVKFANQHKGLIYYGVDFTRIYSKGTYQDQRANDNGFSLYGIYNSKNKHWNMQANLIFNSFKVQENGGVVVDPFNPPPLYGSFFQKNLVPTTDTGQNIYNQWDFYFTTSYSIGKKYWARKNDTSRVQTLLPVFKISHIFNVESSTYSYRDYYPDTVNYERFFTPDSVYNDLRYYKIGNALQLEYRPRSLTSDSTYSEKDFIAFAELGYDYYFISQNDTDRLTNQFGNLYIGGTFRNNYAAKAKIIYNATARYYLHGFGYNQDDLFIDGLAGYDFKKLGVLSGNFTEQWKQAPYIFEHYYYLPDESWNYSLPKTNITNAGGKYQNSFLGITADLNYYIINNLPVLIGQKKPYLTKNAETAFVLHFGNRNSIAGVHFDNDLWYTIPTTTGYVSEMFPQFYGKSSIYYERRVFKKAFWFATGFDVRIRYQNNSAYNSIGPYYNPLLGVFEPESSQTVIPFYTIPVYPLVDFFLNFKIKTVRLFLKVSNIASPISLYYNSNLQSYIHTGFYNFYKYPASDISFNAGVTWRFFE